MQKLCSLKTSDNSFGIYSIKNITRALLIPLLYYGWNYILTVALRSRDENCESNHWRGTIEECHKGRTSGNRVKSGPRSYEHWAWCYNPLIWQPFNPHLTYYYLFTCNSFRSGKCEDSMVCHNSIRWNQWLFYILCNQHKPY